MHIARFTRFLQLRYPQSLSSLRHSVTNQPLYIDMETFCKDVLKLNSMVCNMTFQLAQSKILSALTLLIDKISPESITLFTYTITNPKRNEKIYVQDQYRR